MSVLDAVVPSPFAVTQALEQLAAEPEARDMDASELRYALTHVPVDSMLPALPSSAGEIVGVLLDATEPLTTTEVANRIDKDTQTVRNRKDALVSTGLVQTDGGWRVMLSFRYERGDGIVPETCSETRDDVGASVVAAVNTPPCKCSAATGQDDSRSRCQNAWCLQRRWLRVAVALTGAGQSRGVSESEVVVGVACNQAPVDAFDPGGTSEGSGSGGASGGESSDEGDTGNDSGGEVREIDFEVVDIAGALR